MPVGWEEFTSPTVLAVLAGIVGACIGSFLNVCIHRLPRGESIVWQPSYCPGCRAVICSWNSWDVSPESGASIQFSVAAAAMDRGVSHGASV